MAQNFTSLRDCLSHGYDTVIDVRSPAEFAEDHIPGAINLPVLDNQQRAEVGTIYKQESPFKARKLGAALVFRNAATHIETRLSHHEGGWRPLVYCWRGGQRSGSFTWMLREIGWRAEVVEGGYRSYRRLVSAALYDAPLPLNLIQLGGYTGTAKTEILLKLRGMGAQVLDLEGLAHHRGSLLGGYRDGQPSQKMFESRLASALQDFSPDRPVLVEAESNKIGKLNLPPALWEAMKSAPWIELTAPLEVRAHYLAQAYHDVLADTPELVARLQPLRQFRGHAVVDHWTGLIESGDKPALCQALAQDHYDPAYDKAKRATRPKVEQQIRLTDLSPAEMDRACQELMKRLQSKEI